MRARRLVVAAVLLATGCTAAASSSFRTPAAGAHRGAVLRVGITAPGTVDPGNVYEPAGELIVRTMCDTLVTTDPRDGSLRPALAESWIVAGGGSKLVLRLRENLRFSDGSPLTASDVAYSLSRVASADFASIGADRLHLIGGYAEVHGDQPTDNDTDRRRLSGVRTTDKRTVEISLSRDYADFVRGLADPLTAPVSKRAAEADPRAFSRSPVCAGPYALAAPFTAGATSLRLVRSRAYTPANSGLTGGGASYADEVVFQVYPSAAAVAAAAVSGAVDVGAARRNDTANVQSGNGPEMEYIGLPTDTAPFDKPEVRRALALAISRTELVHRVFPTTRVPATGFLPPTTGVKAPCSALPADGDRDAAVALLAKAGVDLRSAPVPIAFNTDFRNAALVAEVARQWKESLGVTVTLMPMTFAAFLARGQSTRGFRTAFRFSWASDGVDDYLTPLFSTAGVGRVNLSRFSNADLDEALKRRAWKATEPADRALAYRRITDLVCEQMPMIPLTTSIHRYVISPRLGSAADRFVDGSTGQPLLREFFIQ